MKRPTVQISAIALALVTPFLASAQTTGIQGLFTYALNIINGIIVPLIFAIAFLMFIFKVYQYFIAGGANEEKVGEGRKFVVWSMLGFFLMFSIWGLVNILIASIGFDSNARPAIPTFGNTTTGTTPATNAFGGSLFGNTTGTGSTGGAATAQTTSGTTMVNGYPYANSFTPAGNSCNNSLYTYVNGTCNLNAASSANSSSLPGNGQSCNQNVGCAGDYICDTDNICIDGSTGSALPTQGQACSPNGECSGDLVCSTDNVCIDASTGTALQAQGGACEDSANCASGLICDGVDGSPTANTCQTEATLNQEQLPTQGQACDGSCASGLICDGDANSATANTCQTEATINQEQAAQSQQQTQQPDTNPCPDGETYEGDGVCQ